MSFVKLNNAYDFPTPGLGTYTRDLDQVKPTIKTALQVGYRHFDTAANYRTEEGIGEALKEAFEEKLVTRQEVFVVSKLWSTKHKQEDVKPALKKSLRKLQLSYLDLYLIHWPVSFKSGDEYFPVDKEGNALFEDVSYLETWKALEKCVEEGLVRSIGLSNFNSIQITEVLEHCKIRPSVLQVEMHVYLQQRRLADFCRQHSIVLTAYCPLGAPYGRSITLDGTKKDQGILLEDPVLARVAGRKDRTPAQVCLKWLLQQGVVPIPKSSNAQRMRENFELSDFELDERDLKELSVLDSGVRYCNLTDFHPGKAEWTKVPKYPFNADF